MDLSQSLLAFFRQLAEHQSPPQNDKPRRRRRPGRGAVVRGDARKRQEEQRERA